MSSTDALEVAANLEAMFPDVDKSVLTTVLQSCGGEDRSLLSQAACSIAHQICTACARRSPKVLQQWHVFATLRGPYVEGNFLAQRDTVWHFDGVHSCINCAIGCATSRRVLS